MSDIRSLIEKLDQINESEEVNKAIKRGVDALPAKPTIADIEKGMNSAVKEIRDQLQSRDDDSFGRSIQRGVIRFGSSQDFIKRQYLGMAAEKLGLPGLYSMPTGDSYVYVDKDSSGSYKSARFASIEDAIKLYQAGYVTPAKAKELQTKNLNRREFQSPPGPEASSATQTDKSVDGAQGNSNPAGVVVTPIPDPVNTSSSSTPNSNKFLSSRMTADDVKSMTKLQASDLSKDLTNELRKLLNVLNDSKINFKSDIALVLAETNILNERPLSSSEEERLRILIHNLKLIEPAVGPRDKALIGNYLETVPKKYFSPSTATVPADNLPAAAPATKTEPDTSTTSTSKKITWQDLAKLNPQIKNPNLIYPGQEIKLPNDSRAIVDKGDTLGSLAQRWNDGGYNDVGDEPVVTKDPAPASTAPASTAPASTAPTAAPTLKPAEAAAISVKIKTALRNFRNQDSLDRIWMDIKSKENFDAIDAQFRTTGKKGIVDAVNSEWGYNKGKQFIPMLKRLGIATK